MGFYKLKTKEETLSWQLGIVLLSLIQSRNYRYLIHNNINNIDNTDSFIKEINEYYDSDILGLFLSSDTDERLSIYTEF